MKATLKTVICSIIIVMFAWLNMSAQDARIQVSDTVELEACDNAFPVVVDHQSFDAPGSYTVVKYDPETEDSTATLYIVSALPTSDSTVYLTPCLGSLPVFFNDVLLTDTGVYELTYTNMYGCDSTLYVDVHYIPSYDLHDTVSVSICSEDFPYQLDEDHIFDHPGVYDVSYQTQAGCDSLHLLLKLATNPFATDTLDFNVCSLNMPLVLDTLVDSTGFVSWTVVDSVDASDSTLFTINEAGTYVYSFDGTQSSCHDIYVLNVSIIDYVDTIRIDVCNAELPYDYEGLSLSADTTFAVLVTGCDTTTQIVFTVHPEYSVVEYDTLEVCQNRMPYEDPVTHETYITPGDFVVHTPSIYGCDSLTTYLTITLVDNPSDTITLPVGASWYPFVYGDTEIASEGTYDVVYPDTAGGCDIFRNVTVVTMPSVYDTVEVTTCSNVPYIYQDSALTEAGSYNFYLPNSVGGDSVVTVILSHLPAYILDTLSYTLHEIELPLEYDTLLMYEAGDYVMAYQTVDGCDSLQPIHLEVIPAVYSPDTLYQEICPSELPYTFADSVLTEGGLYAFLTESTIPGYDSVYFYNLVVHPNIDPYIEGNQYLCEGNTAALTVYPADHSYVWNTGDTSQIITIQTPATYVVTVTDIYACQAIATFTVDSAFYPVIEFAGDDEICLGSAAELSVSGGASYLWDNGSTEDTIEVYPSTTTTYHVTVTSEQNCAREGFVTVVVNTLPAVYISGQDTICNGSNSTFTVSGTGTNYAWSNGSTESAISVSTEGLYTVTVTDANGCANSESRYLKVYNNPTIQILGRTDFCVGSTTMITATGASQYEWNSGDLTQSITTQYAGTYTVTGTDNHGCSSTAQVTLVSHQVSASIVGNRFFCENGSTTLTVSGNEAYTYQWYDGSTTESVSIDAPGQYTVTVTNALGCHSTIQANVTQYALPTPSITGSLSICQGSTTTLRANGGVTYQWDDGSTQAILTVSNSGTYVVTATGNNGCSAAVSATVVVNPTPSLTLLANENLCQGQSVSIYAISGAGNSYNWSTGQSTSFITVSPTSSSMYTVLVTDANGCTNTASTTITVSPSPNIFISGTSSICQGSTAVLSAAGGVSYLWNNGSTSNAIQASNSGTYSVTATDANGCTGTASFNLAVSAIPTANITGNLSICQGGSTTLTAPSGYSYIWSNNSTDQSITVNASGTYTVTVSNNSGCSAVGTATVAVHAKPTLTFGTQHSICEGESYTYTLPANDNITYAWSNGATGNEMTVNTAGTYSVTATNQYGCSTSATDQMTVRPVPTAVIDGSLTICQGQTTTLRASGGVSFLWDDATTQSYHAVTTSGTYTVTVTGNNGCSSTASATVIVNPTPSLSILANDVACAGESITMYAISAPGNSYNWSTGQTTSIITVSPTVNTMYTVLVSDANGCTATANKTITVAQHPTVVISGNHVACQGESIVLTAAGGTSYQWSNGISGNTNTVTTTGTYTVTASDANGCTGTATYDVQISTIPSANISGDLSICQGQSTTLTAPAGYIYQWSNNSTTQSISVDAAGTYKVTVSNAAGCYSVDSVTVVVHELPTLSFGLQHDICEGQSYTYTLPNLPNITYSWSNGASGNHLTVDSAAVYTVTATNEYGCSTSASDHLVVHPLPVPVITGNTSVCRGEVSILTASGGSTYVWSNGTAAPDIAIYPTNTTSYAVTVTSVYGCSATASATVTVKVLPSINFSGSTSVCEGQNAVITVTGGNNYMWSTGSTNSTVTLINPGTYFVTATNSLGCSRADSVHITHLPLPEVTITGDNSICNGETATLTASGAAQYTWNTQDVGATISVMPQTTTVYTVTATNAQGCSATASRTLTVKALPDVQIAGNLTICQGESTTLTATGGFSYLWNNGSTSSNIQASDNGNYTVLATAANGCQASETVTLNVNPVPVMSILGSSSFCSNQTQTLTATGATSYLWNDGTTTDNITINTGGQYSVTGTNQYGCSSSVSLDVTSLPVPYVSVVGQTDYCEGSSTTLYASTNATHYAWSTGDSTQAIVLDTAASNLYTLTVTADNGCQNTTSIQVNVHETYQVNVSDEICQGQPYAANGFNLPEQSEAGTFVHTLHLQSQFGCDSVINLLLTVKPLPTIVGEISGNTNIITYGSYMYSVTANDVTRYEWRVTHPQWVLTDNNVSSAFLQINSNGNGTLTARAINNCGFVEKSITISCGVSVEEYVNETQILIYPNPVQDVLTVHIAEATTDVAYVTLVDNLGRTLESIPANSEDINFTCSQYAAGVYYVRCLDNNKNTIDVRKIIIKK
ncbi:MAG: T9SS type A sorting domain-containing protein [Bacteroidales bacterium]|nr:T9SS type A sorting domain-containing protein [Bacteroidales bacterium]